MRWLKWYSTTAMIFYVYICMCIYDMGFCLDNLTYILNFNSSQGQHRHLGSGTNMSSSTHRFGYHRSSGVAGCGGGVYFRGFELVRFNLIGNLRVWPYAWRSVQNEQLFHMCHTSILDVLKVLLHILEPDPLPSKRHIIKSIDDFRRMCSIFSQPGASKKHDSNLRGWYHIHKCSFKHGKHHLN